MRRIKHCPKCGSTNIDFPVFYRPSIWKCSDCGYEGAFIIEDGQDNWNCSTDNWQKTLEDRLKSVATIVEYNDYLGLRLAESD